MINICDGCPYWVVPDDLFQLHTEVEFKITKMCEREEICKRAFYIALNTIKGVPEIHKEGLYTGDE